MWSCDDGFSQRNGGYSGVQSVLFSPQYPYATVFSFFLAFLHKIPPITTVMPYASDYLDTCEIDGTTEIDAD